LWGGEERRSAILCQLSLAGLKNQIARQLAQGDRHDFGRQLAGGLRSYLRNLG